jgi:predicted nucleotide-binding protein
MAKRMTQSSKNLPPPNLVEPRESAFEKVEMQIEKGRLIYERQITSSEELMEAITEKNNWDIYNKELLSRIFDNSTMVDEYNKSNFGLVSWNYTFSEAVRDYFKDLGKKITRLESIRDRLELIPDGSKNIVHSLAMKASSNSLGQDVFIVHGHNEAAKEAVSRFIEKLGFTAIILHEQPNGGRTVIEKIEDYSNVGFAIILLTPDDIGGTSDKPDEIKPRARQNVILELGYFFAKLGRQRVCALYKDVELPSDIYGVLYIPIDDGGAWRLSLVKEMIYAGYSVDMNKAL